MEDEREKLDRETEITLHAYLTTFASPQGQRVLDDLRKSLHDKPFDENKLDNHSYLVQRATEHNLYLKIVRMRQRAAELIQRMEGVEPTKTPNVVTEGENDGY